MKNIYIVREKDGKHLLFRKDVPLALVDATIRDIKRQYKYGTFVAY